MVASPKQQETVMDTQKVETCALSDDELDAVSGGDLADKDFAKQREAMLAYKQALAQLP